VLASQTFNLDPQQLHDDRFGLLIWDRDDYMSQPHSFRQRNLNKLLEKTALGCIEMDPEKYSIIVSAACLAKKELNFEDAWRKNAEKYETLLARIES